MNLYGIFMLSSIHFYDVKVLRSPKLHLEHFIGILAALGLRLFLVFEQFELTGISSGIITYSHFTSKNAKLNIALFFYQIIILLFIYKKNCFSVF